MNLRKALSAFGISGALALGATVSASAGPFPAGTAAVKDAAAGHAIDVRWRGRGIGPGLAFGLAAGALAGAAVAARPYGYYGYGPGYYGAPVYADPDAYEPVYPAPGYYGGYYGSPYGGACSTDEGYGRRGTCSGR